MLGAKMFLSMLLSSNIYRLLVAWKGQSRVIMTCFSRRKIAINTKFALINYNCPFDSLFVLQFLYSLYIYIYIYIGCYFYKVFFI
jgi:hypothetical protein